MSLNIDTEEIIAVLRQFNPWWRNEPIVDLPAWHRPAFQDMVDWALWTFVRTENRSGLMS